MARWIVAGLVVLNLMLGIGVWQRLGGDRTAQAQIGAAKGDIEEVAGTGNNNTTVIYMLQASTGSLVALRFDPVSKHLDVVGKADVTRALQSIQ